MKSARSRWTAGVLVGAVVLVAGIAVAERGRGAGQGETGKPGCSAQAEGQHRPVLDFIRKHFAGLRGLKDKLQVTDEQRDTIRGIVVDNRDEIAPLVREVVARKRALREAVLTGEGGETAIRAAADELGKAIGDAAVAIGGVVGEVKGVLTDEQLEILREHRASRQAAADNLLDEVLGG